MRYSRLVAVTYCLTSLALSACSDQPQEATPSTTPSLAVNSTSVCASNVFNSLVTMYFSNPTQQQTARNYKDAMLASLPGDSATARENGFHLMREIAAAAKTLPQPSPEVGSELTVETLKCIFDVKDENVIFPAATATTTISPTFFAHALDRANGGAYDVRGRAANLPTDPGDPTGPVQAVKGGFVIAAVAPNGSTTTWDAILAPPRDRVLIYGEPVPGSSTGAYDMDMIPRAASFVQPPGAIVTTCHEDNGDFTEMLHEEGVGVLSYVDVELLGLCSITQVGSASGFGLLKRLASLGAGLVLPEPLAATAFSPGLTGGNAGSLKSIFDVDPVQITLVIVEQPDANSTVALNTFFPFTIRVSAIIDGVPTGVSGVCLTAEGIVNNGSPTLVVGQAAPPPPSSGCGDGQQAAEITQATPGNTEYTEVDFGGGVKITKNGTVSILVKANVLGRTVNASVTSNQFYVKPASKK